MTPPNGLDERLLDAIIHNSSGQLAALADDCDRAGMPQLAATLRTTEPAGLRELLAFFGVDLPDTSR
ncbi:hypothetical protein ACWDUL_21020 [Nocardia niigatensis]